jgi:hypothetical protein
VRRARATNATKARTAGKKQGRQERSKEGRKEKQGRQAGKEKSTMRKVERNEVMDYETYNERRSELQEQIWSVKKPRRIHLGKHLTFLFENHDTIWYQIQEMVRAERIVKESAIGHEIQTYNALLGGTGVLSCSLLIEIDDRAERAEKLRAWLPLPQHLYVELPDGKKVYAEYDPGQVGEDRVSAVQYLKFDTGGEVPVAVGCDFEQYPERAELTPEQREALEADLRS